MCNYVHCGRGRGRFKGDEKRRVNIWQGMVLARGSSRSDLWSVARGLLLQRRGLGGRAGFLADGRAGVEPSGEGTVGMGVEGGGL